MIYIVMYIYMKCRMNGVLLKIFNNQFDGYVLIRMDIDYCIAEGLWKNEVFNEIKVLENSV